MSRKGRRFAFLAGFFAGVAFLCLQTGARAGITGSPHDFSETGPFDTAATRANLAPRGACTSCHIPHGSQDYALWPRSLAGYRNDLTHRDGSPSTEANFLLPATLSCYDCHDFHNSTDFESPNVPRIVDFDSSHRPQDILFGFTKNSLGSMEEYDSGPQTGKSVPGYYETDPVGPSSTYGVNTSAPLGDTGGHYFIHDPASGAHSETAPDPGDKLPCRDCHDPHAWNSSWQAFIRPNLGGSTGWSRITGGQPTASEFMANDVPTGARSNVRSRDLCIACHGDSDARTPVNFTDINPVYDNNSPIVRPPASVEEHASTSQVACRSCHEHNSISAACSDCHSFPGLDNTNSPRQLSPVHAKHVGSPLPEGTANSKEFDCKVCHFGYSPEHNQSGFTSGQPWTGFNPTNVNIQFDNAWNPGAIATYAGFSGPTTGVGGTGACNLLYCHGNRADQSDWGGTSAATPPVWDNSVTASCGSCHGTAAQLTNANHPVHLDNAANPFGPGIDNATCGPGGACHTAYGLSPTTTHVNSAVDFRTSSSDNSPVLLAATGTCDNCHSTTVVAALDNGAANSLSGAALAKANWSDNTYKLPCLTCHNNASQGNSKIDGTGTSAPNIEAQWLVTGHGAASAIDNASTTTVNTGVDPPIYQNVPVPCGMCHDVNSRHYGTTLVSGNAWRLRATSGYNDGNGGLDKFCNTQCHGSSPGSYVLNMPDLPQDHTWVLAASPAETKESGQDTHPTSTDVVTGMTGAPLASDTMPLDNSIRQAGTQNFLCVSCHDPHGVGPTAASPRSFTGANPTTPADNVHMLRYIPSTGSVLCNKCHI